MLGAYLGKRPVRREAKESSPKAATTAKDTAAGNVPATNRFTRVLGTLTFRVSIYLAVFLVIFTGAVVLASILQSRNDIRLRMVDHADYIGQIVADVTASHIRGLRLNELDQVLEDLERQHDIDQIQIYGTHGTIISDGSSKTGLAPTGAVDTLIGEALRTGKRTLRMTEASAVAVYPIAVEGRVIAAARLVFKFIGLEQSVREIVWQNIRLGLTFLIGALPVAALLMIRATKGISALTAASRRIAAGQLHTRINSGQKGEIGELSNAVGTMVGNLKSNLREIERLAYRDSVTDQANRELFRLEVTRAIEAGAANNQSGTVLFVDLDRFKKVNDTFGHAFGDMLLRKVADRMVEMLEDPADPLIASHDSTVVARIGGDEFAILLHPIRDMKLPERLAAKLIERLNHPFDVLGNAITIGASIGVTVFPEDGDTYDILMRNADISMYAAKNGGRNAAHRFTKQLQQQNAERLMLENDLRASIENGDLDVYLQPQVESSSGRIVAAEALVRWNHPTRGFMQPDTFIQMAEETGLVIDLGHLVLSKVADYARDLDNRGMDIRLAVNVSARQFERPGFSATVMSEIQRAGIRPDQIELELTESAAMNDPEAVLQWVAPLRDQGIRFAIDDFGTGYSSLSVLGQLPFDSLKIDRSFIGALERGDSSRSLVETIFYMAEKLGLEVVAEGVETEGQLEYLRGMNAELLQGYLFSRPLPYADFLAFVTAFTPDSIAPNAAGNVRAINGGSV